MKAEISVSSHDTYSCVKPQNVQSMPCCKICTSRQPNMSCKFLKIETVYIKD